MSAGEARSTTGGPLATSATLRSGAFHNERDYPGAARRAEEQGTVRVSYTIGLDGRVTNCTVTASSGSRSLDTTTCRILERRFRYSPARDSSGNPVSQTKSQSVSWQLT
jgi:protein TonB